MPRRILRSRTHPVREGQALLRVHAAGQRRRCGHFILSVKGRPYCGPNDLAGLYAAEELILSAKGRPHYGIRHAQSGRRPMYSSCPWRAGLIAGTRARCGSSVPRRLILSVKGRSYCGWTNLGKGQPETLPHPVREGQALLRERVPAADVLPGPYLILSVEGRPHCGKNGVWSGTPPTPDHPVREGQALFRQYWSVPGSAGPRPHPVR